MRRLMFRAFRLVHGASARFRRRLSSAGSVTAGILVAAAVLGADTGATLAYQVATLTAALLGVALLGVLGFSPRLQVKRHLPDLATAGEPLRYRLRLHNAGRRPERGLSVRERLDAEPPTLEEFLHAREPGEERRNWFDRRVGYPRWEWLVAQKQGADVTERALPPIPPGSWTDLELELVPRRRGHVRLAGLSLFRPDPLGLARAVREVDLPETLLVLPRRVAVPEPQLPGRRRYQQGVGAQARSVGESEEFLSLRDYRPGDPLRRVHWRSWAKTGHPVVKEFQEEYLVRHALVLDTFPEEGAEAAFEDAVSIAASLVTRMPRRDALLDLLFVGSETHWLTGGRGRTGDLHILEVLASVSPSPRGDFSAVRPALSQRSSLLSGCVCVLVGWDGERRALVGWLRALGIAVEVFAVSDDSSALDPGPLRDAPHRFHPVPAGRLEEAFPQP